MKHKAIIQFTSEYYLEYFPEPIEAILTRYEVSGVWHSWLYKCDNLRLSKLFKGYYATDIYGKYYTVLLLGDAI